MSSRSKGDTNNPNTDFFDWLGRNITLAITVSFIYGLFTAPFFFDLVLGDAVRDHHMIQWFAGYVAISGVVAGVVVKRWIIGSMVVWAITGVLLWLLLAFFF